MYLVAFNCCIQKNHFEEVTSLGLEWNGEDNHEIWRERHPKQINISEGEILQEGTMY